VSWDKDSPIPRPERVSPWQIEPFVRPSPINLLPLSRPKRLHPNQSAAHSNFWHTVNANYQDQQGNHNMFPRSSSMMPPSTGFGLNQQNYPEIHGVGGLPQSSAQPCLIKPQPLVLAHDDAQKMNFNSKKLFGIHLDSSAKPELLKSPPSVLYDGMPQTPEAAECRQPDTTEVEKCSDPIMTLKQLDASQVYCGPEKYLSCVQQSRSCKKVRFLVFIYLVFNS
jgi:hypothetical protein